MAPGSNECVEAIQKSQDLMGLPYQLKVKQKQCLQAVLQGEDVMGILPTGYGKSLIFTLLPYAWDHLLKQEKGAIVIVISPLVALMQDQVSRISTYGVPAAYMGGGDNDAETIAKVKLGQIPIIILSPEALFTGCWREVIESSTYRKKVKTIVVDEAHCTVQWGREFRDDYGRLGELRSILPNANLLALTATAPPSMREDIANSLAMLTYTLIEESANRSNLTYLCIKAPESIPETFMWLVEELQTQREKCKKYIVYCRSIKACAQMFAFFFEELGESAYVGEPGEHGVRTRLFGMYHRSTTKRVKTFLLNSFKEPDSKVRVLLCTIAFGMGVDTADVYMVIHWGASRSFEGFFQESGRAGRDAAVMLNAFSLIYFHPTDISKKATDSMMRLYCLNEDEKCRRRIIMEYFSPGFPLPLLPYQHQCCDICHKTCTCGGCSTFLLPGKISPIVTDDELSQNLCSALSLGGSATRPTTPENIEELNVALVVYRDQFHDDLSLVNSEIRTGLSDDVIQDIVKGVSHIFQMEDLLTDYVFDEKVAMDIMEIINGILED